MKPGMRRLSEVFGLILGCFIMAFAINGLIVPAQLLSGGVTGISILFYHLLGWSVSMQYFLYNIPLLILGLIFLGKKFSLYTIVSVVFLALFLKTIPVQAIWTQDPLLCAIFGGVMSGVGGSIVLRSGGCTGGTDIISRIIARFYNIPFGKFNLVINTSIVLLSAYFFSAQLAMYTLIAQFACSKTYQILLSHVDRISVMIVTDKSDVLSEKITQTMARGVTTWEGQGAYTKSRKGVLFCVLVNVQYTELVHIVTQEDPNAFMAVLPTSQVKGKFMYIW